MHHHPLVLVIKDLWYFVNDEVRYWLPLPHKVPRLSQRHQPQLTSGSAPTPLLLASSHEVAAAVDPVVEDVFEELFQPEVEAEAELEYLEQEFDPITTEEEVTLPPHYFESYDPAVMYVAVEQAVCVVRPHLDFDTVLAKFPYGTAVTVTGYQGSYAKVFWSHHEGWIQKDDLTPHKAEVWPHFTEGITYEADSDAVKKLRLLIGDTFGTNKLGLPLQAGEWVVYRLREQNRLIPWPVSHGRVPGDWQVLLKGVPGIHISVTPKTDSIMEWRGDDGIGRVAYVEKVTADQTLTVTIAGYDEPGRFEERVFTEVEWRELRPVFIEVL
jgi:hypothetical protein